MGEGEGPAPRGVQDLALNLTWFRVGVDKMKTSWVPPPLYPLPRRGGENLRGIERDYSFSMINI
jgi:hypothetical protein